MIRSHLTAALAIPLGLLACPPALAQPTDPSQVAGPATAPTTPQPTDAERLRAQSLHEDGLRHYDRAEYDQAIRDFKAAHAIAPAAGLLFNIAQAYRLEGPTRCPEAVQFYKAFLRNSAPDDESRPIAQRHIVALAPCAAREAQRRTELAEGAAAARDARAGGPGRADEAGTGRIWPAATALALGVAAGGAGTALYLSAGSRYRDLQETCDAGDCSPSTWSRYRTRERWGIGLMAAGGAGVATAALLWWLRPDHRARLALVPGAGDATLAGVSVHGSF